MMNLDVEDTQDSGIGKWVVVGFVALKCHDIGVSARVHGIFSKADVVRCVIDV